MPPADTLSSTEAARTRLRSLSSGFRAAATILTANELGLFRLLADGPAGGEEIRKLLRVSRRGIEALLAALVSLEILRREGDTYRLPEGFEALFREGSPDDETFWLRHQHRLLKRWSQLERSVRNGRPVEAPGPSGRRSEEDLQAYILAMEANTRLRAGPLLRVLEPDLAGVRRILDLGGGPGGYLIALLRRLPEARGALLDMPEVLRIARERIEKAGLEDRVDYLPGDLFEGAFGSGYDLILASNIVHIYGERENRNLLRRCAESLAPGGRLAVQEILLDEEGDGPPGAALFSLNMLVNTRDGRSYRASEIRGWLEAAGLEVDGPRRVEGVSGVLVGRKKV